MKYLFPFLLLALYTGCKKTDDLYRYAVVCDFPSSSAELSWVVISDNDGTILKTYPVRQGASQLVAEYDLPIKDAWYNYNLHLVNKNGDYTAVDSYYGVKNGATVSFSPAQRFSTVTSYNYQTLYIFDISEFDSATIASMQYIAYYTFKFNKKFIKMNVWPDIQQDIFIRIRPNASEKFYSLYLLNTALQYDITFLEWSSFLLEDRFKTVEMPGNAKIERLTVAAVEPDYKRYVALTGWVGADSSYYAVPAPIDNLVPIPNGLNPQAHFMVHLQQGDFTAEKMFQPGEALRFESPRFSIKSAHFSNFHSIEIKTSGQPDMIEASTFLTPQSHFSWSVKGPSESFENMKLPDLTTLLPDINAINPDDIHWQVNAYQYSQLDYSQLLAGFPYKGGDGRLFPIARAGLQKLTKNY